MQIDRFILAILLLACEGSQALAKLTPEQVKSLPPPAPRTVDFAKDIQPMFEASCTKCHARGKAKGGFSLDTRVTLLKGGDSGASVVLGNSAQSLLIELVSGVDPDNVMPQKGSRLTREQVGLLRAWIDQGAVWEAGVTFAKPPPRNLTPRQPELSPVQGGWSHPVDRLLQPYFAQRKITPAPPVDDRTFARRAYLDVIGLLPAPDRLQAFLADARPDKRERWVHTLLADHRRYAEHWLTFWNDALRNDYRGTGYIDGGRKQISDWLYGALARNLPYDLFVSQLVNPSTEAEGFIKGIVWRGAVNASQTPELQAAQNIAQVFLGVNLKCASCHDSFINDWTLADAYGLASVYATHSLEMFQCDKPTGKRAPVKFLYPELGSLDAQASQAERQRRLADIMTCRENGRLSRTIVNRLWARFMGRGLVEPLDDMEQAAWCPDLLDWLAEDLARHGYNLKHTIRRILTSRAYQLPAVNLEEIRRADFVFNGPAVRRLSAEQFRDALGSLTGVWAELPAGTFDFTVAAKSEELAHLMPRQAEWIWSHPEANRKALAQTNYFRKTIRLDAAPAVAFAAFAADDGATLYINSREVARVTELRTPKWVDLRRHLKAGENLVAMAAVNYTHRHKPPPTNAPPNEPDASPAGLIFYAHVRHGSQAHDFVTDSNWLCSTNAQKDWEKPWPANPAESGAPTNGVWFAAAVNAGPFADPWDAQHFRERFAATLSAALVQGETRVSLVNADPLTTGLGRPNREQVITSRPSVATTLQALELTNGETLSRILAQGAAKLLAAKPATTAALVDQLYGRALGRSPTTTEMRLAVERLGEPASHEGVEDLLWAMTMLPEFQLIH